MKQARLIGNYLQRIATEKSIPDDEICDILGCERDDIMSLYKGRLFLTFPQIEELASKFGIDVMRLLAGDEKYYEKNVVHCMNKFTDSDNREKILDIIDDYLDLQKAIDEYK